MRRRIGALVAMAVVGLVGLAGIGLMLWGGFVRAIVYEDGSTPGELPGYVLCIVGLFIVGGAARIGKLVESACEGRGFDPVDDFLILITVLWFGGLAAGAVAIAIA